MPNGPGVRTARKLLVGIGIGLAFISLCSVAALIYLSRLNTIVRHLALDPVPGSAAIASMAKDFNQYRVLEVSRPTSGGTRDTTLARKAAEIERDLKAYDGTITQSDDRRQFAELAGLWSRYGELHGEMVARQALAPSAGVALMPAQQEISEKIDALLTTMVEWNRLEGVRSIDSADSRTRVASATVLAMLLAALLLSALRSTSTGPSSDR